MPDVRLKKPFISANQVTFLRLCLMPLPGWLLYQGVRGCFVGLIIGTLIGCTDFVDGYLARKYGPTVLGGLMDPIADKVFIAVTYIPALQLGWSPAWLVALLFVREFAVTAARTAYERRGLQLKSSYLARYKTWVQMCGVGVLFMMGQLSKPVMVAILATGAGLSVISFAVYYAVAKKVWRGASIFAISFAICMIARQLLDPRQSQLVLAVTIAAITWLSGLGYLFSVSKLRGRATITSAEVVRLVTSVAFPLLIVAVAARGAAPAWALIGLVSLELAHGGLDNLLAHHHVEADAWSWGVRIGGECALLGFAWVAGAGPLVTLTTVAALALAMGGLVVALLQNRRYYLETSPVLAPANDGENAVTERVPRTHPEAVPPTTNHVQSAATSR